MGRLVLAYLGSVGVGVVSSLFHINDSKMDIKKDRLRILHVDDDASMLMISKEILIELGNFEVDQACCVDEAFKKLAIGNYDAVVSDYEMPKKDGLEFLKELREQKNEIPFILFTGKGREEVAIKALNLGAQGYINKQGNPETVYGELSHVINQIVDHNKAKNDLHQRDTQLIELASQTPGMLFQFKRRPNGTYCVPYTSEAIRDIFGCSPKEVLEDFSPIAKVIVPQDLEKVIRSIEDSAQNMTPWHCEYRVQLPGQQIHWLWGQSIPKRLNDNSIIWYGFNADITERKAAEQVLLESEAKYRELVDYLPEMIFELDTETNVVFGNARIFEFTGYTQEDLLRGLKAFCFVAPEDRERASENIKKVFAGNLSKRNEYMLLTKDAKRFPALVSSLPIFKDGKTVGLRGIISDLTEHKKSEELLKASVLKYRAFAESLPEIVFEIDTSGNLVFVNNRASQITGYGQDEFGVNFNFLRFVVPAEREKATSHIKSLMSGEDVGSSEYNLIKKNGSVFPVMVWATPFVVENKIAGLRGIVIDISERKQAEEELNDLMNKLVLINEKLGIVGDLTRHDVGNKLSLIKSNVYLLKKRVGDDVELNKYLESITSAVNSSDRLFEFSQLYEKMGSEELLSTNVSECFSRAVALLPNLGEVRVVNDCTGLEVVADSLLSQLFYNLIDNSLKHGEKVTQIRLNYSRDGVGVRLFYEDDGVGVPDSNKSELFKEGFTTGEGSGLGLKLIKKMVEVYGWTITEEGEAGKGAKFVITIPAVNNKTGQSNY